MKVLAFVALLTIVLSVDIKLELLKEDPQVLAQWQDFLIKYRRTNTYQTTDDIWYRYNVFKENLNFARYLQENELGTAIYGVTKFMDMTKEEFKEQYLTLKQSDLPKDLPKYNPPFLGDEYTAPDSYDWRDHGAVTAVKNQAQCGSCWAFSTIANIEGQYFLKNQRLLSFSEQQLVDCDTKEDQGCNGGLMQNAFVYLETNGFELESDYKYTARDGSCKASQHTAQGKVASWVMLDKDEGTIAETLSTKGPLSAAVNAAHFQTYISGVMDPWLCNASRLDHGITLVGYGTESGKDYWLIKNSWGSGWGEKGYCKLIRGKGKCGINTNVCTATLA